MTSRSSSYEDSDCSDEHSSNTAESSSGQASSSAEEVDDSSYASDSTSEVQTSQRSRGSRRSSPKYLLVMRHGERTDDLFPGWIDRSTRSGHYVPYDLNMPRDLKFLHRPMANFHMDTPLTMMGSLLAQFVGRAMAGVRKAPDVVYASPALRCVQTAHNATLFSKKKPLIRVEPGLFENNDLYPEGRPKLMTVQQLHDAGYNVDLDYEPVFSVDQIWESFFESNSRYNRRVHKTFQVISEKQELLKEPKDLSVLICAHASTVDMAAGYLVYNGRKTTTQDLIGIAERIPYASFTFFGRNEDNAWKIRESDIPFVTYNNFTSRCDRYFIHRRSSEESDDSSRRKMSVRHSSRSKSRRTNKRRN
uniref:Phosphoglycerate mutase-like protein n=1 Tax=Steinernema glaseri TaxID=37863 RepID=A0A1I7Y475_9BILA